MNEITSGVRSALKSWLAFGASISGGGHKPKSISSVRKSQAGSVSSLQSQPFAAPSRLEVMFRDSEEEDQNMLVYDEEMGPETLVEPSYKSQRAAQALTKLNKGEQKLNRKAGEKMQKVCTLL